MNKTKRTKTILAASVLVATFLTGTLAYFFWPFDTSPHLYKSATSQDGAWTVQLFRKYRSSVWQHPVDILIRVNDRQGDLAFEKSLYIVDSWNQAEEYCSEITFDGTKIILGPGVMYADGPGFYVIDTSNLKGMWLHEMQSNNSLNRTRN